MTSDVQLMMDLYGDANHIFFDDGGYVLSKEEDQWLTLTADMPDSVKYLSIPFSIQDCDCYQTVVDSRIIF